MSLWVVSPFANQGTILVLSVGVPSDSSGPSDRPIEIYRFC